nr:TIGR01244 family phosphatase [Rhizobium sp. Khangiran2]
MNTELNVKITTISEKLSVSSQPSLDDIQSLREQGFKTLINNRPDDEDPDQPGTQAEAQEAKHCGLSYAFIPVTGGTVTDADVRAFQHAVDQAGGPVLAHCKSGTRSLNLYLIGEVLDGRMSADEVVGFGRSRGYDTSAAAQWLEKHAARRPHVKGFFDKRTWSVQYVVSDPTTRKCAIIDPVLDFDEKSGATATINADAILDYIRDEGLTVEWILDTHPHADHFSAAHYLKEKTGAKTAIGERVVDVQKLWKGIYNWPELATDGSQWDQLFAHGETFKVGSIDAKVMFSPGHTLASITYVIGDAAFVHDTLFMPDSGTARADFPGGDARILWKSIQDILALPDETRIFTGHDYQPNGRAPRWESTVAEQKKSNPHLAGVTEEEFVALRTKRDKTLPMPKLILHALQVNIRGGRLPEPESNGKRYLRFPLDALQGAAWE